MIKGTRQDSATTDLPRSFSGGRLRRLRTSDLVAFQAYRSIPEVGRFQGWVRLSDVEALTFLAEMGDAPLFIRGEWVQLGIADVQHDHLVGDIGVFLSHDGSEAELGFTLAPAAQGRGLATAAVREALQLLFDITSVTHVLAITDARNAASIRLVRRLGFHHRESRDAVFRGEPCCEEVYVLPRNND